MNKDEYEAQLKKLQVELVRLQDWVKETGQRVVVVFEGRDAAGKGGVIKAITERVSPRVFRVIALPAPSDREKTQLYSQRYITHMPAAGEIMIFDRSWYNRAGVERVMGFATEEQVVRFLALAPRFEEALIDDGIILLKYWLEISNDEQEKRFKSRIKNEIKQWKLSAMDLEARRRWYAYSKARDEMLAATDTDVSPWYIVRNDDKERGRLNCIKHLLSQIPYESTGTTIVKLPDRDESEAYDDQASIENRRFIPEEY
jgi:polyphosphate kinase 2